MAFFVRLRHKQKEKRKKGRKDMNIGKGQGKKYVNGNEIHTEKEGGNF